MWDFQAGSRGRVPSYDLTIAPARRRFLDSGPQTAENKRKKIATTRDGRRFPRQALRWPRRVTPVASFHGLTSQDIGSRIDDSRTSRVLGSGPACERFTPFRFLRVVVRGVVPVCSAPEQAPGPAPA